MYERPEDDSELLRLLLMPTFDQFLENANTFELNRALIEIEPFRIHNIWRVRAWRMEDRLQWLRERGGLLTVST